MTEPDGFAQWLGRYCRCGGGRVPLAGTRRRRALAELYEGLKSAGVAPSAADVASTVTGSPEAALLAIERAGVDVPEWVCRRCGGPNPLSWFSPSPLWNAVMRGGSIDGPWEFGEIICPTCFCVLAAERGVASVFVVDAQEVHVELEVVTPGGRVWDPEAMLWVDPSEAELGEDMAEQERDFERARAAGKLTEAIADLSGTARRVGSFLFEWAPAHTIAVTEPMVAEVLRRVAALAPEEGEPRATVEAGADVDDPP